MINFTKIVVRKADDMSFVYNYPRPAVTTDAMVFLKENGVDKLLLIQRKKEPYIGTWAFPGGFIDENETLDDCVKRELKEETGLTGIELKQYSAFSEPKRDPRHRTITVVYYAFIEKRDMELVAGDDADAAQWFPINNLPQMAFDHDQILRSFMKDMKVKK